MSVKASLNAPGAITVSGVDQPYDEKSDDESAHEVRKARTVYWIAIAATLVSMALFLLNFGNERFWLGFNLLLSWVAIDQESSNKHKIVERK